MKRVVLLGGGHAQLAVLESLAAHPLAGCDVRLVTPFRRQIYSGMLPGWVAGHYPIDACAIALDALAARAGVTFHEAAAVALNASGQTLRCDDGSDLPFDLLSLDTGPVAATDDLPGSNEHALPIRPIEAFVAAWPAVADRMRATRNHFDLTILGAGAAGVELAFAVRHRAITEAWPKLRITLVGSHVLPLHGAPPALQRKAAAGLAERAISWAGDCRARCIEPGQICFDNRPALAFDACLVVTGAAAPSWPGASGLATDARGFIRVGPTLQSVSHPRILAAGDVASLTPPRPKSGVFAVRAGPMLANNLRALCEGRAPKPWHPQRHALYLISTGDRHALASWGRWSWQGDWVWRWKDRIDRKFVERFGHAG